MAAVDAPASFEMRGVRKTFGATVAVDRVDLAVREGEVCALVGQNGAGKSTLMSILAGATKPDAGEMTVAGAPFRPKQPQDARRAGIAMIHQELAMAPDLTVMENILLGDEPARGGLLQWGAMRAAARAALAQVGRDDIQPDAVVGDLPLAAQQMVEIARALHTGAKVLVMDEPTSSLGRRDVQRLFDVIARLKRHRHAVVYISHFLEEVREVADRVVVLRDGRVAAELPPSAPASEIVTAMVGQNVETLYPRSPRQRGEAVLTMTAPAGGEVTLHRGEIVGVAGLIGAGRTRLVRSLFARQRWADGVGMLSEDRKNEGLAGSMSVADNLTLSRMEDMGPGPIVLPWRQRQAASRWIDRLAIRPGDPGQPVAELSGGNQQKVALARLLHHDVDVFLLDEPTRGIDVASKAQIYALLDALVAASAPKPRAILLISSYFPELLGLCDRIAVMRKGRLGPARAANDLTEHQLVLEATGAEDAA